MVWLCFLILEKCLHIFVQLPHHVQSFVTPWTTASQASLSLTISQNFPKLMFISQVMPSSHLILWCPLLLLPLMFPNIRNFYKSACCQLFGHQMTKILELQFYISPSCEYSGLISLKINWFDLLAVQGTFRSLLQHHSSKASIIWHSAFSLVQLTQLYWLLGRQYPWRYGPLLKEWCLLSTHHLGLSLLSCEEVTTFWFHGCNLAVFIQEIFNRV